MEEQFNLDAYFGTKSIIGLREQLYQPIFLKTHLDIVYSDIINWEREKLLDIDFGIQDLEGEYKKTAISFIDYIWLKIVSQLRSYGFSYSDILLVRGKMAKKLRFKQLNDDMKLNAAHYEHTYDHSKLAQIGKMARSGSLQSTSYITYLELLVLQTITEKLELKLLFFKGFPQEVFPLAKEVIETIDSRGESEATNFYLHQDHFSFSFYKLFIPFLSKGKEAFDIRSISILTNNEQQLIKKIRRNYKDIKTITVRFSDNGMTHIEITKAEKRVSIESRLMEYIKKGDYADINIKTVDGRIVHFENTKKYKL